MKRTHSGSTNQETPQKICKDDSFLTTLPMFTEEVINELLFSSSDSSSSDNSTVENIMQDISEEESETTIEPNYEIFIPSEIERQVIRKSFACMFRSNMSDWDVDNSDIGDEQMTLRDLCVFYDADTNRDIKCEIIVHILYTQEDTHCDIEYQIGEDWETLSLHWQTDINGSYLLTISKNVTENCLYFFSYDKFSVYRIYATDHRDLSWCYFNDVRRHLFNICP